MSCRSLRPHLLVAGLAAAVGASLSSATVVTSQVVAAPARQPPSTSPGERPSAVPPAPTLMQGEPRPAATQPPLAAPGEPLSVVTQAVNARSGSRRAVAATQPLGLLIPDSEFVYGPTGYGFDTARFVSEQQGFLAGYAEVVAGQTLSGAEIIDRLARELSLGPRMLLTLMEMHSGWVTEPQPANQLYPVPEPVPGLDAALRMAAGRLLTAYYEHRRGGQPTVLLADGNQVTIPGSNAGSYALLSYFARAESAQTFAALGAASRFYVTWTSLFGDPYFYDSSATLPQAPQVALELPFPAGEMWFYVSGPRSAAGPYGPLAAIDFAPPPPETSDCGPSSAWVLAAASGRIARSDQRELVVDLDGDGFEGSGWVHVYRHLSLVERASEGQRVKRGDRLGHPGCEGSAGPPARVSFARRYNGEWIAVDDARQPLLLGGWLAVPGRAAGEGYLIHSGATTLTAANAKVPGSNGVLVMPTP